MTITAEELLRRYANGERDFSGVCLGYEANLIGVDLRGINLSKAEMITVKLIGANLDGANLIGANFEGADLTSASFVKADSSKVCLDGSQLVNTNFADANLAGAKFIHANIIGTTFCRANLQEAGLWELYACVGADFTGANLRNSEFFDDPSTRVRCACIFNSANLLGAEEFVIMQTDIFNQTTMPDGSIRNE